MQPPRQDKIYKVMFLQTSDTYTVGITLQIKVADESKDNVMT